MSKASLLCKRIKKSLRLYGFHNLIMDVLTVFSACMSIFAAFSRNDIVLGLSCLLLFFLLIIVSISFYLYKKDSVKLDHLYIDNYVISPDGSYKIKKTPLISTITYLILTRHEERKLFNDLSVSSISTDYSFSGDPAHTEFDGNRMPISEQKISYTINSMNRTSHPIFHFDFYQIWSILAKGNNTTYAVSCKDVSGNDIPCQCSYVNIHSMCNRVTVKFECSGISPQQCLSLHFNRTNRPAGFHNSDAFVFDPAQYDDTANFQWHPSVNSDSIVINESDITIYTINRTTFEKTKLFSCKFKAFNAYLQQSNNHGNLKCSPKEIFLINITQSKETFVNTVHCQSTDENHSFSLL